MGKSKTFNFTKKNLDGLAPAKSGQDVYRDASCKGLCLHVTATGHKTFYLRATFKGKQERFLIGPFPAFEIGEAREAVHTKRSLMSKGIDPNAPIKQAKQAQTLDSFFQTYLEQYAKPHKKTWDYDEKTYRRHLSPTLGGQKLVDITREQVAQLHLDITSTSGKSMANHSLSLLTALYNRAGEWGAFPADRHSPTKYVKKLPEPSRTRRLTAEEMSRLIAALMSELNMDTRDYTLIALTTGVRKANILSMRWEDIDWQQHLWRIPMTKNGEHKDVALPDLTSKVLSSRYQVRHDCPFVFPSNSKTGHLLELRRSWKTLMTRANIQNFTRHDLRRTFASWLGTAGASSFIISKSLGQKDIKSAMAYTHLHVTDVKESSEMVILKMLSTLTKTEKK